MSAGTPGSLDGPHETRPAKPSAAEIAFPGWRDVADTSPGDATHAQKSSAQEII